MKELEKTQRISISTVAFILIIIIGFLTFRKPTKVYAKTQAQTLEILKTTNYLVSFEESLNNKSIFIDIRNRFEFDKGHIENAINIPTAEILDDLNLEIFKTAQENNRPLIIYGTDPINANSAWMLLYQLGFDNVKILNASVSLNNNELVIKAHTSEQPIANYTKIFNVDKTKINEIVVKTPIKVIPKMKKKKRKPEGGC